jgi:L-ascorbate metabolism protein UlaG (beta-lactamase superfamily)
MRVIALLAVSCACLAATADGHVPPGARGGGAVASAITREQTVAARTKFFGADNVDQRTGAVPRDKVLLSWFGVTNFAMAIRGHVVLLDAWVPRGAHSNYVPTTPDELAQLDPEFIVIGHAHFDHAADAVPIAEATGATLVGTEEHCADFAARAVALPPRCIAAIGAGAPAGTVKQVDLMPGVRITAVKHLHSATSSNDGYHVPVLPAPSLTTLEHPPTSADVEHLLGHLPDAEGGTVLYRFEVGKFSMVWNDSAGPLTDTNPGVLDVLRTLGPVDVQVGAIQGFNQFSNGLRDPIDYIEAIRPKLFVPGHHDDWVAGITTKGENYKDPFYKELATLPAAERPAVNFITDPGDYLRAAALSFDAPLKPLRLKRTCAKRLRVRLRGDAADVSAVRFRGARRTRRDGAAPFTARLPRRAGRVRARIRFSDGTTQRLARRGCTHVG